MSIFLMVGCIGLALAPFIITSIASAGGFNKLWLLSIPGVILALILIKTLSIDHENRSSTKLSDFKILFAGKSRPLWIMFLIMFIRSLVTTSFMSFMSILFTAKGLSMHRSGIAISTFLISGSAGGVIGGYLADKISRKIIIAGSSIIACPLLLWFLKADGNFAMILLGLSGMVVLAASAVNVLIVQRLCPDMAGSIAGVSMGLVWGSAGLMLPVVGYIADHYSMETSLRIAASMLPISGILVLALPNIDRPANDLSKE
jgi:FSR family fosmidomycin resistance protein-like MFS transporter